VRALLIGDPQLGPSWDEAAPLLGAEAAQGDALSQYLVGRNLWLHGRAAVALEYLNDALEPEANGSPRLLPPASILREARRLRIVIACSEPSFSREKARDDARRLREDPDVPAAKKEAVLRFAKRCGL
jgi:hypothetical protein